MNHLFSSKEWKRKMKRNRPVLLTEEWGVRKKDMKWRLKNNLKFHKLACIFLIFWFSFIRKQGSRKTNAKERIQVVYNEWIFCVNCLQLNFQNLKLLSSVEKFTLTRNANLQFYILPYILTQKYKIQINTTKSYSNTPFSKQMTR